MYDDAPALAIGAGILAGLNLLGIIVGRRAVMNESGGQAWTAMLIAAGFLMAGSAFKGMHDGRAGTDWLLLPASNVEKYAAALITYMVVYPIAASLAALGLSALLSLIELAAGGPGGRIWNPLSSVGLRGWINYMTGALVFIAGSAAFRKRAFIKTLGVSVAYGLAAAGIFFLTVYFTRRLRGLPVPTISVFRGKVTVDGDFSMQASPVVNIIMETVRYALIPLFSLFYGYFRVAEKEARDEVQ
jgi:hypothetical protein